MEKIITKEYLKKHPTHIFVFGDNNLRRGMGGAASLRNEPNSYGFITKKEPTNNNDSFYQPDEYKDVFKHELTMLIISISNNPDKTFLISKLGAGLANRFKIHEQIILPELKKLKEYKNVEFLFDL